MFWFKKKEKQDPVRDLLVRDLMKSIQSYHDDYTKLIGDYKKLTDMYRDLHREYGKVMKCFVNYIECGSSDKFKLLMKEHMIGEDWKGV